MFCQNFTFFLHDDDDDDDDGHDDIHKHNVNNV